MDPILTLLVTAVALGAAAGLKPATEQAIRDAYAGFKRIIIDKYHDHRELIHAIEAVDEKPEDIERQTKLKHEFTKVDANKDPILIDAANVIYIVGASHNVKRKVLVQRLQIKLKQVEAYENDAVLGLDSGQTVIIQQKAANLWEEIAILENELLQL